MPFSVGFLRREFVSLEFVQKSSASEGSERLADSSENDVRSGFFAVCSSSRSFSMGRKPELSGALKISGMILTD